MKKLANITYKDFLSMTPNELSKYDVSALQAVLYNYHHLKNGIPGTYYIKSSGDTGVDDFEEIIVIIMIDLFYTTLQLFHKKNIVQDFLMYNEFAKNITKESDPVRQKHYTTKKH